MQIRNMRKGEADALGRVMWDAIHRGAGTYTPAQRVAWCPAPPAGAAWAARLMEQRVWVADRGGPVGFVTLAPGGYVDLAFVIAAVQGQGVFARLLDAVEAAADTPRLWTHASLSARPAFAARGFHVIRHETVARGAEMLDRAEMEKMRT
ncbi:MAG: GNAT family N-acetyltransferase [Pseudomonadota bacterium]